MTSRRHISIICGKILSLILLLLL